LVKALTDRSENAGERQQIIVYASIFPKEGAMEDHADDKGALVPNYPKNLLNGDKLEDKPDIRLEHPVARAVSQNTRALWVVAAGQHKVRAQDAPQPVLLEPHTPQAPQNLGDLAHVIVVTACADCGGTDAKATLWPNANRAATGYDDAVSIAAPGVEIPGPVVGAAYAEASGTSESTAFVAGVAAAMSSCYPDAYRNIPSELKKRLVLTGRPYLFRSGSPEISPIVVIDPQMALRNPALDWLVEVPFMESPPEEMIGEPQAVDVLGWCVDQLPVVNAHGNDDRPLKLSEIRRLMRRGSKWVAFEKQNGKPFGPFTVDLDDLTTTKILKTSEKIITLSNLGDILLNSAKALTSCN
jgi:hypothetical protein